ncbi:terpene cyclase [Streptomyces luteoverticillatus]|uniref:Terpene synthase n=1 Tax=Streptomyces luteoverticillatus TaxID=66425 RepID=A0A3Q9G053_STRLT|nr:terpene cyclase [Streptomyces luteoverticillatus]AZQ74373.1 terpene cyclase [Streptomyces luteoverticillatus]
MPQDIEFRLPFPSSVSRDLEGARQRNLAWVRRMGLVREGRSLQWFASWDMPLLAACGFPYAQGPALDLCADAMAFFFVFDDQFDGPLGQDPARAAAVSQQLIDIVHGTAPAPGADACSVAFADLWARCTDGAHPGWVARTAFEWEYYFATQAHEAIGRLRGAPADMETYLQVRRGIAGTDLPLSLGERAAGVTVPASALHSPQLRIMRQAAIDVTFMCNDVYSLEKEEARGDMDNLVLVLEHAQTCTRDEAVTAARSEVDQRVERFREQVRQVPAMCLQLGLTGPQREAVTTYVEVMGFWMTGYHAWQTQTRRYTSALRILPHAGPGYFDEVLGA